MATQLPRSHSCLQSPTSESPQAVPRYGSDETADPFPLAADIVGRPLIHPHRLAQTTRDYAAIGRASEDFDYLRAGARHVNIEDLWRPATNAEIVVGIFCLIASTLFLCWLGGAV